MEQTKNKTRMAVLVTSCDAYEDIWFPFFKLMDKYWSDIPYNVYLNTEKKRYEAEHKNFSVKTLNLSKKQKADKTTWSKRMLETLEKIEEEYVLILVEDFFLRERVQTELIENILDKMDEDPLMSQVQFFGTRTNCDNEKENTIKDAMRIECIGDDKAKVCFVPVIWRKRTLKKWLRPHETIWAFESCGAKRAKLWKYKEQVYRVYDPAIFNYLWEKGCYCVVNGKWMEHPLLTELFEKNDIKVDFSIRGTITMEEWDSVTLTTLIKRNGFWGTVKKAFNRFRSLF